MVITLSILVMISVSSYAVGSFPSAYYLCKWFKGKDIRELGSGNVGATNVFRNFGWPLAITTAVIDVLKGLVPVLAVRFLLHPTPLDLFMILAGICAVLGHSYSPIIRFSGGKGIATSTGALLGITPYAALIAIVIFVVVIWRTRIVSLGSIWAAIAYPLVVLAFYSGRPVLIAFSIILSAILILRHKENIKRLKTHTEPQIKFRS